jgi:surface antigen/Ni/Co efflux regulator RcnB
MKRSLLVLAALSVLMAPSASAAPGHGKGHERSEGWDGPPGLADKPYGLPPGQAKKLWRRGERIPPAFIVPRYFIVEPRVYHLAPPRPGYRWVAVDGRAYLIEAATGLVADMVVDVVLEDREPPHFADDREDRWRHRYARTYSANDDSFYRECHQSVDPAGVVAGAVIGGVLGNALGHGGGKTGATIAGVVVGGALGAALTRNLDCEDRGYAYKTYAQGFSAGRPNSDYHWRNPSTGHYGDFRVADYYNDPDGFRCANYTQKIFVDGKPQAASGRACQQPDGSWAIVS